MKMMKVGFRVSDLRTSENGEKRSDQVPLHLLLLLLQIRIHSPSKEDESKRTVLLPTWICKFSHLLPRVSLFSF